MARRAQVSATTTPELRPLRVTAKLASGMACQYPLALDGLLAALVAAREDYPPPSLETRVPPPESLPLLWHPAGCHHASQAHLVVGSYETIRWSRKAPALHELAELTSADKVQLGGRWKAYWMPLRKVLPVGMTLTWWAVGDPVGVAELLRHCFALGQKRNAGHGWVSRWTVEPWAEDWSLTRPEGEGLAEGRAVRQVVSRNLPAALAPEGWLEWRPGWASYPYWRAGAPGLVAVPAVGEVADAADGERW